MSTGQSEPEKANEIKGRLAEAQERLSQLEKELEERKLASKSFFSLRLRMKL
jgi:hypothetical protein